MLNKKVLLGVAVIYFNLALTACENTMKTKGYKVYSTKETENSISNTVLLPRIISKDSTIAIARQIRMKSTNKKYFVCSFYQPGMELSIAWAVVTYPTDSTECNSKDKDGTCVEYKLVVPGFKSVNELRALKANGYDRKNLIKEAQDVYAKVKYEIYKKEGKQDQGVMVVLYPGGGQKEVKLKIKQVNGITKYVFDDPKEQGAIILEKDYMTVLAQEGSPGGRAIYY